MSGSPLTYPAATLAKLFGLSERRIHQLSQEGVLVKAGRGVYELLGSIRGYVSHLQKRLEERWSEQECSTVSEERKRLLRAQAEKAEHELATLRGDWVRMEALQALLEGVGSYWVSGLASLPSRLAPVLAGETEVPLIRQRIEHECEQLRRVVAKRLRVLAKDLKAAQAVSESGGCEVTRDAE